MSMDYCLKFSSDTSARAPYVKSRGGYKGSRSAIIIVPQVLKVQDTSAGAGSFSVPSTEEQKEGYVVVIRGEKESQQSDRAATGPMVLELRRLSGLTWEQLATVFQVSRRSLHFWASGKALNAANEEKLFQSLAFLRSIDTGLAAANRESLLKVREHGRSALEMLQSGDFEGLKTLEGKSAAQRKLPNDAPSAKALKRREIPKPEALVGALQDPLPRNTRRTRRAKALRKAK